MIVGIFYWSLSIAGIFYPYFAPIFIKFGLLKSSQIALGIIIIFIFVMSTILIIGYIYDVGLRMWAEHQIVSIERNIFAHTKQSAKEIVQWQYLNIPLLFAHNCNSEANFWIKWNRRCMIEDEILRNDVITILNWVNESKSIDNDKKQYLDMENKKVVLQTT